MPDDEPTSWLSDEQVEAIRRGEAIEIEIEQVLQRPVGRPDPDRLAEWRREYLRRVEAGEVTVRQARREFARLIGYDAYAPAPWPTRFADDQHVQPVGNPEACWGPGGSGFGDCPQQVTTDVGLCDDCLAEIKGRA